MALTTSVYNLFFRRSSSFMFTVFAGAFVFEAAFDTVADGAWDYMNRGRQWKDIRHKYINAAPAEESE
ncbi:hypothetical protein HK097_008294 [Rhizophlyctis rosea]|uniref:Complex III subunit 9 n=1 Tax=Rhizophlyctis rosea TaxID=64517 RepID=A0AAD5X7W7_9FUNG|nr:hypothetical protein HK097_008294 [Rhizophlyctis rosea]